MRDNIDTTIMNFSYGIRREIEMFIMMIFNYDQGYYLNKDHFSEIYGFMIDIINEYSILTQHTVIIDTDELVYRKLCKSTLEHYNNKWIRIPESIEYDGHTYHVGDFGEVWEENKGIKMVCDLFLDPKQLENWSIEYVTDDPNALDTIIYKKIDELDCKEESL